MKATIIIQNRNYAATLRKTILSCIIQDFPKDQYEIIGYDADSTDESMFVYNLFKNRIKVIEVGKKTQPEALNIILRDHAKGDYIAIINSDDWLLPHFLKTHINTLDEAPEDVVMAYSNSCRDYQDNTRDVYMPKSALGKLIPKDEIFKRNFIFQPSVMMKRSALDKIGLFDERYEHAWDYKAWIDLAKIGKWVYIDSITTVYRLHQMMNTVKFINKINKETKEIIRNVKCNIK